MAHHRLRIDPLYYAVQHSDPLSGALKVTFPSASGRLDPFNLIQDNPSYPFLGFISSTPSGVTLGNSFSAVVLGGVQQATSPYLGPSPRANTYYASPIPAETSVWIYNDVTGQLTPQWINSDATIPSMYYAYYINDRLVLCDRSSAHGHLSLRHGTTPLARHALPFFVPTPYRRLTLMQILTDLLDI
ncbi:hypothetical protein D9619_013335 [Psilocybe cf. subviscida]|uniref:Uncharacterized protein n=1 Tax=Psilocybe cf. subviscida TaxID=2480587 RepID=A0A8H5BSN0_9AGAR|nr:hypothetical protein D9619_013335 [Psilocybe cf. subviscida]